MTNWLERAKREIPKTPDWRTANTDVRPLSAVTAVPHPGNFEKNAPDSVSIGSNGSTPLGHIQEIDEPCSKEWTVHFIERDPLPVAFPDPVLIEDVFSANPDAIAAIPEPLPVLTTKDPCPEGMCVCRRCKHLTKGGVCLIATPGGVVSAAHGYRPALPDTPQRCPGYVAKHKKPQTESSSTEDNKDEQL